MDRLPAALVDLVVSNADGNPFYLEELVKMLIEEGVVQVRAGRALGGGPVPPPGGVGTADAGRRAPGPARRAPGRQRTAVQHASVIGRTFWDDAVGALLTETGPPAGEVGPILDRVRRRELVWRNDRSSFSGCAEYRFKHALLRDAAYETVLLRARAPLHAAAAAWMERRGAGDRIDEHLAPIADHLASAGEHARAASLYERAADKAVATGGIRPAITMYQRCLDCLALTGAQHGRAASHVHVEFGSLAAPR